MDAGSQKAGRSWPLPVFAVLTLLGMVLLTWALLSQQGDPPAPTGQGAVGAGSISPPPTDAVTPAPDPGDRTTSTHPPNDHESQPPTSEPPEVEASEAATEQPTVEALEASEPLAIRIPSTGVDSAIHALGLEPDGSLQVPSGDRFHEVAWYDGSPTPGELGPSVVEGHVTGLDRGPSVFFELGALQVGDRIEVDRADGSTATFEVYATDSFPKDSFPRVAVYGNTQAPELRLITCGGDYDEVASTHVDNVVVFAVLVD